MDLQNYDTQQINQINKGLEDGNKFIASLANYLDINIFRAFRTIFKEYSPSESQMEMILNAANNKIDITKITKEMFEFDLNIAFDLIQKYDQDTIKLFYLEGMTDEKRKYICKNDRLDLLKFKNYNIELMEFLSNFKLKDLEENIIQNSYSEEQLHFIIEMADKNELYKEMLNSDYSVAKMTLIKTFIDKKIDLSYIENMSENQIEAYNMLVEQDYDILKIYKEEYTSDVLDFILDCLAQNKDADKYLERMKTLPRIATFCYMELCLGPFPKSNIDEFLKNYEELEKNQTLTYVTRIVENISSNLYKKTEDISSLFRPGYTFDQLGVLQRAFQYNIDLGNYCTPEYSTDQMQFIFELLKNEMDVSTICNPQYSVEDMKRISFYNNKGIFFDTLEEYYKNYTHDKNNDFKSFIELSNQINEYRHDNTSFMLVGALVRYNKTHEYQVDIEAVLESKAYCQFEEFFEDLDKGLDVNKFWKKDLNTAQRKEIKKGLLSGIDVNQYSDASIPADKMKEIRKKLENGETLDDKIEKYKEESKEETDTENKRTTGYLR